MFTDCKWQTQYNFQEISSVHGQKAVIMESLVLQSLEFRQCKNLDIAVLIEKSGMQNVY